MRKLRTILIVIIVMTVQQTFAKLGPNNTCPNGGKYKVSITLDDGPHITNTETVLDILKEENVRATFFVLGEKFVKSHPYKKQNYALLDRMKAEGHYIGSHTFHHVAHSGLNPEESLKQMTQTRDLLQNYMAPITRLPYAEGSFPISDPEKKERTDRVMEQVNQMGLTNVGYKIDTEDWDPVNREKMPYNMLAQICYHKGGIILMHDIKNYTAQHLREWIVDIRLAGHEIVGLEHFISILSPQTEASTCINCEQPPPPMTSAPINELPPPLTEEEIWKTLY